MSNPILLPIPKKVRWKEGSFSFGKEISVYTDLLFAEDFGRVYRELKAFTGSDIKMTNADEAEVLFLLNAEYGDEEHDIKVEADKITICSSKSVGAFRAITTLKQIHRINARLPWQNHDKGSSYGPDADSGRYEVQPVSAVF